MCLQFDVPHVPQQAEEELHAVHAPLPPPGQVAQREGQLATPHEDLGPAHALHDADGVETGLGEEVQQRFRLTEPALLALDKNFISSNSIPSSSVIFVISLPTTPVAPKTAILGFFINSPYSIFSSPYTKSLFLYVCLTALKTPSI